MKANRNTNRPRTTPRFRARFRGGSAVLSAMAGGAVLLMLGSCAQRELPAPPPPPPPPRMMPPPPMVVQPAPVSWRDAPLTPGEWQYRQSAASSGADFGVIGQSPLVEVTCQKQSRTVEIVPQAPTGGPTITIHTSSLRRTLTRGGQMPPAVSLAASDPLLDAMAFSRGRFAIEVGAGAATLILPARPEISRVIEDCRQH